VALPPVRRIESNGCGALSPDAANANSDSDGLNLNWDDPENSNSNSRVRSVVR
jgi:hypothetical protein